MGLENFKLICRVSKTEKGTEYTAQVSFPKEGALCALFWTGVNFDTVLTPIDCDNSYRGQTSVDIQEIYKIFDAFLVQVENDDILFDDMVRI